MNAINFKDLETKGFLVIREFLTQDEVQEFINLYYEAKARKEASTIKNKNASVSFSPTPSFVKDKINNLLTEIAKATNLTVNFVFPRSTYFDNEYVQFGWHQDHDTQYMWQDSYNFLNCWIPLIKPDTNKSGLTVVPYDKILPLISDKAKERLIGHSAKIFFNKDGQTVMRDDSVGDSMLLEANIEHFEETPAMTAGDLLLLRGDLIHKTQDTTTSRVSVSIRSCNADHLLSKEVFYTQCPKKKLTVENDVVGYKLFHDRFSVNDFVPVRDMFKK